MRSGRWWLAALAGAALVGSSLLCAASILLLRNMCEMEATAVALMRERDTVLWPKTGVFAGYYRRGWETSDFRPAGTKEQWWLDVAQTKLSGSCGISAPCYLVVRGNLSGLGRHGHLGYSNRELEVTEIIEQRPLNSDEKVGF
jgi:hypothetical protein